MQNKVLSKNHPFNLLRTAVVSIPFSDKVFVWLSGTCKVILLFTQIVVIATFMYRVVLDRELNDLNDAIKQNTRHLEYYAKYEPDITNLQREIYLNKELDKYRTNLTAQFIFFKEIGENITQFSLTYDGSKIFLSGNTSDIRLTELEKELKNTPTLSNVLIQSLERNNSEANTVKFSISANLNKIK